LQDVLRGNQELVEKGMEGEKESKRVVVLEVRLVSMVGKVMMGVVLEVRLVSMVGKVMMGVYRGKGKQEG
jgi:phage FluMu protein gp41